MGAKSFTDLDCWKLANDLKLGVYQLLKVGEAARDHEFKSQLRNAAASAPRNIAEGFGRYQPREMAQYLRVANGSLMETANQLQDGVDRSYFKPDDVQPLLTLARRASAATTRLIRHLNTARAPNPSNPLNPWNPRTREPENRNPSTEAPSEPENPHPYSTRRRMKHFK